LLLLLLYLFSLFVGILHFVFLNILQNAPNLKFDSCNLWHALKIASMLHGMGKWQPKTRIGALGNRGANIDVCALGRGCLTVLLPPCCQSKVKVFLFVEVSPLVRALAKLFVQHLIWPIYVDICVNIYEFGHSYSSMCTHKCLLNWI